MNQIAKAEKHDISTTDTQSGVLSVIERAALDPNVDITKMERLLDMQERIMAKQAEMEFNRAMNAVQSETKTIKRNRLNTQTQSNYTTLDALNAQVVPIYSRHGFSLSFGTAQCPLEKHIRVTCTVLHSAGHSREYFYDLPYDMTGIKGQVNKTEIHASASTLSYGRRYLTMLIFNISTGDDVDGNQPTEYITEQQMADLESLISEVGADRSKFLNYCKVDSLAELPASKYQQAIKALEAKRK